MIANSMKKIGENFLKLTDFTARMNAKCVKEIVVKVIRMFIGCVRSV